MGLLSSKINSVEETKEDLRKVKPSTGLSDSRMSESMSSDKDYITAKKLDDEAF